MRGAAIAGVLSVVGSTASAQVGLANMPWTFVPNAETATSIARAVLIPIYGAKVIQHEEPLIAERHGDIWIVHGTLCPKGAPCLGGVAEVQLSAPDGRILHVTHSK